MATTTANEEADDAAITAAATATIAEASHGLGAPRDPAEQFPSYVSYFNNFKKYVDNMRAEGKLPRSGPYTSRLNIDRYAIDKVASLTCGPANARSYFLAIAKWAAKEHFGDRPEFNVESDVVLRTLAEQKKAYARHLGQKRNVLRHPKEGLRTNVLSPQDNNRAIDYIMKNEADWASLLMAWTKSFSEYLRGDSVRALQLGDIVSDFTHVLKGDTDGILTTVLRKGEVHKDRFKHDRVVGSIRHKDYRICPQGAMSLGLWYMLRFYGRSLVFDTAPQMLGRTSSQSLSGQQRSTSATDPSSMSSPT